MESTKKAPPSMPVGYALVVPREWARIPLQSGSEQAVREVLDRSFGKLSARVPREKLAPFRREAEKRLLRTVSEARSAHGLELYIPVEETGGTKLAASFVVSAYRLNNDSPSDPQLVAMELASEPANVPTEAGSSVCTTDVDGALAVRQERVFDKDPSRGAEMGSRRVDYYIAVPGDTRRWLGVSFSGIGSGDPHDRMANALVRWFDALMATFVWKYS